LRVAAQQLVPYHDWHGHLTVRVVELQGQQQLVKRACLRLLRRLVHRVFHELANFLPGLRKICETVSFRVEDHSGAIGKDEMGPAVLVNKRFCQYDTFHGFLVKGLALLEVLRTGHLKLAMMTHRGVVGSAVTLRLLVI